MDHLKVKDIINYNGWPCRVDSAPVHGEIVLQSLGVDDLRRVGPEVLRTLELDDETLKRIATRANMLELLEAA